MSKGLISYSNMALKKGYCTNCNKNDETRRIFDVNPSTSYCHCPHCGKRYRPKVAINNYNRVLARYLKRASYFLRNVGDAKRAYGIYAYILELEFSNSAARMGRLLALSYLSSLRRNRFKEAKELLLMDVEQFREEKYEKEYSAFLLELSKCTDEYMYRVEKKLTFKDYFYDVDCLKLYYKNMEDVIDIKRLIVNELSLINEEKMVEIVSNSIKNLEEIFKKSVFTADGKEQKLVNFGKSGEPLIVNGYQRKDTTKIQRYRMSTLDPNNKKATFIKDVVFSRTYIKLFNAMQASIALIIVSAVIALVALIIYLVFIKNPFILVALILAIVFGVLGVSFVIMRLILSYVLTKKRY